MGGSPNLSLSLSLPLSLSLSLFTWKRATIIFINFINFFSVLLQLYSNYLKFQHNKPKYHLSKILI
jgi:hypothetical protein